MDRDCPHVWEVILIAAVPIIAFLGWVIPSFFPNLLN